MSGQTLENVITVQGIKVEGVTSDTFNDYEIMEAFAVLTDPDADSNENLRATASICPTVFGSKQWKRIKAELREQNGGRLTAEIVMDFMNEVMEALDSKNS